MANNEAANKIMKMPAKVAGMFQSWLRAALLDRPTKEQADVSYLHSDTPYIQNITPTENGFFVVDHNNVVTVVDFPPPPDIPELPGVATNDADGLMSATDKRRLDNLAPLTAATSNILGGVTIGKNISASGGRISVNDANTDHAGVTRLYGDINDEHTDGAVTQAALKTIIAAQDKKIAELEDKIKEIEAKRPTALFRFKGSVATYADLPKAFLAVGDVYNIEQDDEEHGVHSGNNVAWTGDSWNVIFV